MGMCTLNLHAYLPETPSVDTSRSPLITGRRFLPFSCWALKCDHTDLRISSGTTTGTSRLTIFTFFLKYYFHLRETFFFEKKVDRKKKGIRKGSKRGQKGVKRGQKGSKGVKKGSGDPFFPDRYFSPKTYSDEKINTCDMMLSISPCISAYKLNENMMRYTSQLMDPKPKNSGPKLSYVSSKMS